MVGGHWGSCQKGGLSHCLRTYTTLYSKVVEFHEEFKFGVCFSIKMIELKTVSR